MSQVTSHTQPLIISDNPIINRDIVVSPSFHNTFQPIVYKFGRRCYSLLVKKEKEPDRICLFGSNDYIDGDFVVACDYLPPGVTNPKLKKPLFFSFRSYIDYFHFFNKLSLLERILYEIIRQGRQKPHFDADIEFKLDDPNIGQFTLVELGTLMKISLLSAISDVMAEYHVNYNNDTHILFFDSSTDVKQSFHVVINGFYHANSNEANLFYRLVKAKLPLTIREYLDNAVYKPNQQFRLIGNHKIGKNNVKVLDEVITKWKPIDGKPGDEIYKLRVLEASMISFTADCLPLPSFASAYNTLPTPRTIASTEDSSMYEAEIITVYESSSVSASGTIRDFSGHIVNINSTHHFRCPICNCIHDHENPQLILSKGSLYWDCRRRKDGVKSLFIGRVGNHFDLDHFDPDDYVENNTSIVVDKYPGESFLGVPIASMDKTIGLFDNVLIYQHNNLINDDETNKLDDNLSLMSQSVSVTPIVNTLITPNVSSVDVHKGYSLQRDSTLSLDAIEKLQTTLLSICEHSRVIEGKIITIDDIITIATFLQGNTKYIIGNKYTVEEIYNAYENYRIALGGKGTKYYLKGGTVNNFGAALIAIGHYIERLRVNGNRTQVVTLRPSLPITNTNAVEAIKAVQDAIVNTPNLIATEQAKEVTNKGKSLRLLNPHQDILEFRDIYLINDPEAETDLDNLHLSFVEYCETKKIRLVNFGKGRLVGFFKKWVISPDKIEQSIDNYVLKGWKIIEDKEESNNIEKERRLRKIWHWNTAQYHIGWHNGKDRERFDKTGTPQWKKIDVRYYYDENIKSISQIIEFTDGYLKSLPDRVKDVQDRMGLSYINSLTNVDISNVVKECDNLKALCASSLVSGIFTDGSNEHVLFMNKIDELNNRVIEMKAEVSRVLNAEVSVLKESIADDLERIKRQASWCISVRSTFGTGKTVNLKPFIEAFPDMKVLMVLPRKTLTDEVMREYRELGFEIYTETPKGAITGNRIIVCYPSLLRVRGNFNLTIVDEYKSCKDLQHTLVAKTKSKNNKGKYVSRERECYNALKYYIANTQMVYIADALLTNAHVLEISRMRKESQEFNKRVTVYQNMYQKHSANTLYTVNNQNLTAHKIMECLRLGMRVTLADNSKVFAEFLNNKIRESDLNITTCLITADHKATDTLDVMFRDVKFISYSPTILSGNSYTEAVDVVFGYFTTASCDQADALQMLMRCRNVTSKRYYICVEQGPRKTPIPDHINSSFDAIKAYLIELSRSSKLKNEMKGWSEEFRLPIEMAEIDYINDGIMDDDPYFISYVNFVKQCVIAERAYLFTMLLYMRDCGFKYGGNIYATTIDKPIVAIIKEEKNVFKKERVKANYEAKSTCEDITTQEYIEIVDKPVKSKDEKNQCYKYRVKRKYKVENTPVWFLKAIKNKQHSNITKYLSVNGVIDQKQRYDIMKKIRETALPPSKTTTEENTLTANLLQSTKTYDAVEDIESTWTSQDLRVCEHSLNILKIIGAETFIRDINKFDVQYGEFGIVQFKDYISQNEDDLRTLVNDFRIKVDNLASKVTNKAFGIKITATTTGYTIINMWVMNQHNLIWPYNRDSTDREELRILPPEPTIEDKAKIWLNSKLTQMTQTPNVESVIVKREPATAIRSQGLFLANPTKYVRPTNIINLS